MTNTTNARPFRRWALVALAILAAHAASISWNSGRLFGDVNLFALVSRVWLETGSLSYPGKYDFSAHAAYLDLDAAASQHPPGWSWAGGVVARLLGCGSGTHLALQLAGTLAGLLVALVGARLGFLLGGSRSAFACALALGLHPYLVDYAGNGSPYLWLGLATLVIPWCALETRLPSAAAGALSGLAVGAAASFHGAALALVPFGLLGLLVCRAGGRPALAAGYILALGLAMLPTVLWMQDNFSRCWFTTTTDYVYAKIGRLRRVNDAEGIRNIREALSPGDFVRLGGLAARSTLGYVLHLACELGWLGGAAALVAAGRLRRERPRLGIALAFVALGAVLPCLAWPSFKYRFLCSLLPMLVLLAAWAWSVAPRRLAWTSSLAVAAVLVFWGVQWTLTGSPAKYYAFDREHRADYALMRDAVLPLAAAPAGLVLLFPNNLDGGTEAAYWYAHRSIFARGSSDRELLRLAADFRPDYALLNPDRVPFIKANFPSARLLRANSRYAVYQLRP